MQKTLKIHILIGTVLHRLSPHLLLKLGRRWCDLYNDCFKIEEGAGVNMLLKIKSFRSQYFKPYEDIYESYKKKVIDNLNKLRVNDPVCEKIILEAHLLGVAVDSDICDLVSNLSKIRRGRLPESDYITTVFLKGKESCIWDALRLQGARRTRSYNYFVPGKELRANSPEPPRKPTPELIENHRAAMSLFFHEEYGSYLSKINVGVHNKQVFLDICHAGACIQGTKVEEHSEDTNAYVLQPVECDTLIFDLESGDLRIHMEKERVKVLKEYVSLATQIFFEDDKVWGENPKYTLAPLTLLKNLDELRAILSVEKLEAAGVKGIKRVRLTELQVGNDDTGKMIMYYSKGKEGCLSDGIGEESFFVPKGYIAQRAKFCFDFRTPRKKGGSVGMNLTPRKRSYDGSEDLRDIDTWLELSNFEENFRLYQCAVPDWIEDFNEHLSEEPEEEIVDDTSETPETQETEEKKPDVEPVREEHDVVGDLFKDAQNMGKAPAILQTEFEFGEDEPT